MLSSDPALQYIAALHCSEPLEGGGGLEGVRKQPPYGSQWVSAPRVGAWHFSPARAELFRRLDRNPNAWNRKTDRGFLLFKKHNGFCKRLIKCKISPSFPHLPSPPHRPLFAKRCVNDSTLTSSPFRSPIVPRWFCSRCCAQSQRFHYNFLFSGVFTVVIKIQSRLKLGIPGLLPGGISFCCI